MFRTTLARNVRLFSTARVVRKDPVTTAKETVQAVDRTVSDQIVKGIEKGREYTLYGDIMGDY